MAATSLCFSTICARRLVAPGALACDMHPTHYTLAVPTLHDSGCLANLTRDPRRPRPFSLGIIENLVQLGVNGAN